MVIVGTAVTNTKVKVDGSFIDGSQTETISAVAPPNPPENQIGKDVVLYLNPVTGELFWDYVDRPLTNTEQVTELNTTITDLVQLLADKGVIY